MQRHTPTRRTRSALALAFVFAIAAVVAIMGLAGAAPLHAQYHHQGPRQSRQFRQPRQPLPAIRQTPAPAAPIERRPPPTNSYATPPGQPPRSQLAAIQRRDPRFHGQRGEHLAQWMNEHSNLTLPQQQQAMQREPGFRDLPPQTQQRILNHLAQLSAMPPVQRQREISHIEWMEHLTVDQRAQVRGPMEQLGSLPPDQRHAVARSFRELRALPPGQRAALLNSGRYNWMTPEQRATLDHLLQIEPLLPPPGR